MPLTGRQRCGPATLPESTASIQTQWANLSLRPARSQPPTALGAASSSLPSLRPGPGGLPVAATFLCIRPQSPELHQWESSGVVWSSALVKRHETQRHTVDFPNAQ